MRITDIEVLRMQAHAKPHSSWLFIRIHTDSGITNIGEGSLQYKDASLAAEVKHHHQRWWLEVLHLEGALVLS